MKMKRPIHLLRMGLFIKVFSCSIKYGPFLIGRTFVCEHSWEYSANVVGSSLGELLLCEYSAGYLSNCDTHRVQKALLNMLGEYSPYLMNLAFDWLRVESSPVNEEEKKRIMVLLGTSLTSEGICLFVDLWEAQHCLWDPEWVVSWITLWGMIKVYWLDDLTLAYTLDHAVCCASAASCTCRSLHLIISQLRTKYSSSNCPNHVQRTMNSRNEVNEVKFNEYAKLCSAKQMFIQLRTGVKQCILLLLCVKCSTGCKRNKEKNSYYTYVKNKILSFTTAGMTSENCEKGWTWTGLQAQSAKPSSYFKNGPGRPQNRRFCLNLLPVRRWD